MVVIRDCNLLEWTRVPGEESASHHDDDDDDASDSDDGDNGGVGGDNYQSLSTFHVSGSRICLFLKLLLSKYASLLCKCHGVIAWETFCR